jgi:hypothetical protein
MPRAKRRRTVTPPARTSIAGALLLAAAIAGAPSAHADGGAATCRKLRAEARSQASLLYAPRLVAGVVHLPPGGALDPAEGALGDGNQARGSVALSPTDMWRGHLVMRGADAECRRVAAAERLEPVLRQGVQYGRAAALRAQIAYLTGALPRVGELVAEAEARLARQIVTAAEVDQLRDRHHDLRRSLLEARHELSLLEEQGLDGDGAHVALSRTVSPVSDDGRRSETTEPPEDRSVTGTTIAADLADYERATLAAERERSSLRRVSPWQVDLRVGLVPDEETHWFGVVEVSYSLGDLWQRGAERAYLDARTDELRQADAELRVRTERFTGAMERSAAGLGEELALIDEELALLASERERLGPLDGDRAQQRRIVAEMDSILLGARRSYLAQLLAARAPLAGSKRTR